MFDDTSKPYSVNKADGRFEILDETGRVIVACADDATALNYAVLLNEAYKMGYKAGYRDGRKG